MIWRKPQDKKYTDLCIFIDNNIHKLAEDPQKNCFLSDTIYSYIWLIIKALAIKRRYFVNFEDYDAFAFHGATRIYKALLKNIENQGKVIKGKEIKPIKSCLNYIKALMYPMKVEYQNEAFMDRTSLDFLIEKMGWDSVKDMISEQINESNEAAIQCKESIIQDFLKNHQVLNLLDVVLEKIPFKPDSLEYKRIRITILMYSVQALKTKRKLEISRSAILTLWKLPKSIAEYVKLLIQQYYEEISVALCDSRASYITDDAITDQLMSNNSASHKVDFYD